MEPSTQKKPRAPDFSQVMTKGIGNPLNLWGCHVAAKARRADEPNKPAGDPYGLGSTHVLPPLSFAEMVATDRWNMTVVRNRGKYTWYLFSKG